MSSDAYWNKNNKSEETEIGKLVEEHNKNNKDSKISVIKVGQTDITDKELADRYKKSNKQLKSQKERLANKVTGLQADNKKLQAEVYLNTDGAIAKVNEALIKEKNPYLAVWILLIRTIEKCLKQKQV